MSSHRERRPDAPERAHGPKKNEKKRDFWSRARSGARRAAHVSGKTVIRIGAVLGILIVLLIVASFFVDEPMRRTMERKMNASLKGYSVQIPKLHFSLFGASVTLKQLTVRQQANPNPPVIVVPRLKASVQWEELLTGHLVADFLMDKPRLNVNLPQLEAESKDPTPMKDKGWQDAVQQIYPLKINLWRVNDADVVYIDDPKQPPLHIEHLYLRASNIRNIHSREHVYPSPVHAEAVVFGSGHGVVDGHADFLAKPIPGLHTNFQLDKVPLDNLKSITRRANLELKGGTLSTHGELEYAAKTKNVHVADLTIQSVRADYIHTAATAPAETARKEKVSQAAKKASNRSDMDLRLDRFEIRNADIGLVNRAKDPPYRAFISGTNLTITNLSNKFEHGPATATVTGKFMGSGTARATAHFRPDKNGPDFDLDAAIENTDMTKMNDMLRAYGKFDVVAGKFFFYSELRVKNGQINGYVKPLFQDMKVYDKRQDAEKSAFRKLYEKLVGGISKLLENKERKEVATKANISGPVSSPNSSTLQVIGKLIENAFIKAILPGFDEQLANIGKGKGGK
ncbi:MAG TPA: DUF748 domain-containing protein [Thermoanaerobaculia bacterium]|nr:DUF748 domain-containing protein [Thermoanaerobaculia bacterium]